MEILEFIGAIWETITGVDSESKVKRISSCVSLVLLAFLIIILLIGFLSGKLVW